MWRVIVGTLIAAFVIIFVLVLVFGAGAKGGAADREQELEERGYRTPAEIALLDDAWALLSSIGITTDIDNIEILRPQTRAAVEAWRARYRRLKGIKK